VDSVTCDIKHAVEQDFSLPVWTTRTGSSIKLMDVFKSSRSYVSS